MSDHTGREFGVRPCPQHQQHGRTKEGEDRLGEHHEAEAHEEDVQQIAVLAGKDLVDDEPGQQRQDEGERLQQEGGEHRLEQQEAVADQESGDQFPAPRAALRAFDAEIGARLESQDDAREPEVEFSAVSLRRPEAGSTTSTTSGRQRSTTRKWLNSQCTMKGPGTAPSWPGASGRTPWTQPRLGGRRDRGRVQSVPRHLDVLADLAYGRTSSVGPRTIARQAAPQSVIVHCLMTGIRLRLIGPPRGQAGCRSGSRPPWTARAVPRRSTGRSGVSWRFGTAAGCAFGRSCGGGPPSPGTEAGSRAGPLSHADSLELCRSARPCRSNSRRRKSRGHRSGRRCPRTTRSWPCFCAARSSRRRSAARQGRARWRR